MLNTLDRDVESVCVCESERDREISLYMDHKINLELI